MCFNYFFNKEFFKNIDELFSKKIRWVNEDILENNFWIKYFLSDKWLKKEVEKWIYLLEKKKWCNLFKDKIKRVKNFDEFTSVINEVKVLYFLENKLWYCVEDNEFKTWINNCDIDFVWKNKEWKNELFEVKTIFDLSLNNKKRRFSKWWCINYNEIEKSVFDSNKKVNLSIKDKFYYTLIICNNKNESIMNLQYNILENYILNIINNEDIFIDKIVILWDRWVNDIYKYKIVNKKNST